MAKEEKPYVKKWHAGPDEVATPVEGVHSDIWKIPTTIKAKERPYVWWGPTPDEARRKMVNKPKYLHDKTTTLKEAVDRLIRPGINIGVAGFVNTRNPFAICHEIARQGHATDLTLSMQSQSMDCEILLAEQLFHPDKVTVKRVELAWWAYEVIGSGPMWTYHVQAGLIEVDDYTNYGASARFKAAGMGIPFIPVRDHGGTNMETTNRSVMIKCPFTGRNVVLLPACHPDVGVHHVQAADMYGNCRIFGFLNTCPEIALASVDNIVTTEVIIPNDWIRKYPNMTEIPFTCVDALIEQRFGGYCGAVWGHYWFDMDALRDFRNRGIEFRVKGNPEPLKQWMDTNIWSCETFDDYLAKVGYPALDKVMKLDMGQSIIL